MDAKWKAYKADGTPWCCDRQQCQGHQEPARFNLLKGFEGYEFSPYFFYHWNRVA